MFKQLFKKAAFVIYHNAASNAVERDRFLEYFAYQGYKRKTLQKIAPVLLAVAHEFRDLSGQISEKEIQVVTQRVTKRYHPRLNLRASKKFSKIFFREAVRWFRFLGRFIEPMENPLPFADKMSAFVSWMVRERGLSPATIKSRQRHVEPFLRWYSKKKHLLSRIAIVDIDEFLAASGARGVSRIGIKGQAHAIRAFLKYAGVQQWCPASIAEAIHGPRIYAQEKLPAGPSWGEIKRLLSTLDTDDPYDIRDRAVIMLLAIYGLRASEVAALRFENIDWEHDQIVITRYKRRQSQLYPLIPVVGNALVRYLKEVRPRCRNRELFLTMVAPRRPVSVGCLYAIVAGRMKSLGIQSWPHHGPHSLRHACAGNLVSKGLTLKEIGDHLGHRSSSSTRIYAKVDLAGLREVASFDLGGVL